MEVGRKRGLKKFILKNTFLIERERKHGIQETHKDKDFMNLQPLHKGKSVKGELEIMSSQTSRILEGKK